MKITVTQQDIDNGERRNVGLCPVALAMRRARGEVVFCGANSASLPDGRWVDFPRRTRAFIARFDKTGDGKPFTFRIPD